MSPSFSRRCSQTWALAHASTLNPKVVQEKTRLVSALASVLLQVLALVPGFVSLSCLELLFLGFLRGKPEATLRLELQVLGKPQPRTSSLSVDAKSLEVLF